MSIKQVAIALIRQDGNTQPRSVRHVDWIEDYSSEMLEKRWDWSRPGAALTVFFDGECYWLADGFHRRDAAEAIGLPKVPCDVRKGTMRDAQLYSCSANALHGQRRTNEDKRRAVLLLLGDKEWSRWSDREIARRCAVDKDMVARLRPSLADTASKNRARSYTTKHGTPATMDTTNIGHTAKGDSDDTGSLFPSAASKRDEQADEIHRALQQIAVMFAELPADPEEAAARYPMDLAYNLRVAEIRTRGQYLIDFADTFERTREGDRVRHFDELKRRVSDAA